MDHPIRSAFSFFSKKYERILLIILLVQIPLLTLYFFFANYMYAVVPNFGTAFSAADIYNAYFMIILFFVAQIPFIYYWHYEESGEEKPFRLAILQSVIRVFHFFVFAVSIGALITLGLAVFVLPGLIIMAMFISAPLIAITENKSVWKSVRESIQLFKRHHWKLLLLIIAFSLIEFVLSFMVQVFILNITTSYLAVVLSHLFINTIFFPLFYLTLAFLVAKWRKDLGLYAIEESSVTI
ncbi:MULTISPECIES: hypothetical protein [Jeotgalibacillus]|uniref:hypothetical protein n=1 Tax=Jeotgalibacillus TaxID=157226 RepID=UPI001068FB3C|nr:MULTISPECIES: hypothetical protein [Jeotgalibacillus]TFD99390.1 hypothetical protein E2491_08000 [Jeotgalibacillus sp. R-1-5s-1]